jgi:hypothetical protein
MTQAGFDGFVEARRDRHISGANPVAPQIV